MAARKDASRRELLRWAGIGSVGLAIAPAIVDEHASVASPTPPAQSEPRAPSADGAAAPPVEAVVDDGQGYLRDLVGKRIGEYRVESVGVLERGGIPVGMKTSAGVRFRVDVMRFDPTEGKRGIGAVSSVTTYLCNNGDGRKATDESLGLGAMALAKELARRERAGEVPPSGLLTMGERASIDASLRSSIVAAVRAPTHAPDRAPMDASLT